MGSFNTQGYDIIIELSEREVQRQARGSFSLAPPPQSFPLPDKVTDKLSPGATGFAILKFRTINVRFDPDPDRTELAPTEVNRIFINLPFRTGQIGAERAELVIGTKDASGKITGFPLAALVGGITIEARLEVLDIGTNRKDVFIVFTPDGQHPDDPKVIHDWGKAVGGSTPGSTPVPIGLKSVREEGSLAALVASGELTSNELDDIIAQLHTGLEEGVRDFLRTTGKLSLTPEPKSGEEKGIAVDAASTDPFQPRDLAVRAIRSIWGPDASDNSLAFLIQTCGPPTGTELNPTGDMTTNRNPRDDVALMISNWLLLRCVIRAKLTESLGLAPEDFDDTQPCALAREVATATPEGASFHLTSLTATVEGDHIRVDGGMSKETWVYTATASFTVNIRLVPGRERISGGRPANCDICRPDPKSPTGFSRLCRTVTILPDAEGGGRKVESEKVPCTPSEDQEVFGRAVTPVADPPVVDGPHLTINTWLYVVLSLGAGSLLVANIIHLVLLIIDCILDGVWAGEVTGGLKGALRGQKSQLLGPQAESLGIETVSLDDLAVTGDVLPAGPSPGALVLTDGGVTELDEYVPTPMSEGSDALIACFLYNRSATAVHVSNFGVQTDPADVFSVLSPMPLTLQPGAQEPITLRFRPSQAGPIFGNVIIDSNDGAQPRLVVPLVTVATHLPRGRIKVTPTSVAFTGVVGRQASQSIEVENVGEREAHLLDLSVTNENPPGQFEVPHYVSTRVPYLPTPVPPGERRTTYITHTPSLTGYAQAAAVLRVQGGVGYFETHAIGLSATVTSPKITLDPATLDFGPVPPGSSKTLPLRILNDGDAPLTVSGVLPILGVPGTNFSFDPTISFPFTIVPSSSQALQITYYAGVAGEPAYNEVNIVSDDPTNPRIRLRLTGLSGGPRLVFDPDDRIEFGLVTDPTAQRQVTIRNEGSVDLHVEPVFLKNGSAFALIDPPTTLSTIAPGGSLDLQIEFNARVSGSWVDRVVVDSDYARRPQAEIVLIAQR
jgi:hypothetical protein